MRTMASLDADGQMDRDSNENCFSELRRLASNIDIGVKEVKSRVEEMSEDDDSDFVQQESNETAALLFLRRSQKDIKEISSNVKSIHDDFKMRSSALNSVSNLFEYALESFKGRLENVENFIEQYGYKRPVLTIPETKSPSVTNENVETNEDIEIKAMTETVADMNIEKINSENGMVANLDQGTPKLEDFGLSEDTMFKLNSGYYDNLGNVTPQRNISKKIQEVSSEHKKEISTPKLEDYGISEHTMKYLNEDLRPMGRAKNDCFDSPPLPKLNSSSDYNNFDFNSIKMEETPKERFDLPSTPKLDGLSEHTLTFLKSAAGKENVCLDSTHAVPKTKDSYPSHLSETPTLESYGLSEYTLRFFSTKEENKRSKDYFQELLEMPATPKLDGISEQTMMFLNDDRK